MERGMSKVIQIVIVPEAIFALKDDGTIWRQQCGRFDTQEWEQLTTPPELASAQPTDET